MTAVIIRSLCLTGLLMLAELGVAEIVMKRPVMILSKVQSGDGTEAASGGAKPRFQWTGAARHRSLLTTSS